MSNLEGQPAEVDLPVETGTAPCAELLEGRDVPLGRYTVVRRSLPNKTRRTVGAWCFLDHFGPEDVAGRPSMRIPPHPHTGLQTVSWLTRGEVRHRDSLGSDQVIYPGQLNIMTAGRGIAHSENSPGEKPPLLHGLQLWVALPSDARWNFVARSHEEIVAARDAWMAGPAAGPGRFGVVPGGEAPLPAPTLPTTRLLPRPRYRRR